MIIGERILEATGNKVSNDAIKGLNINITLEDVQLKEGNVEITYAYTANYDEKVGFLRLRGVLIAKEENKLTEEIISTWKKSKKIPDAYAEMVLSAVNYSGSANGTLLARILGLTAPLIPPRIQLGQAANKK